MTLQEFRTKVGQNVGFSEWTLVTQDMVNTFADATGDHQFIHVDPERASQTQFGGTIAHGFLTLSLLAGHLSKGLEDVLNLGGKMVVNVGLNKVRFLAPVMVGTKVRCKAGLVSIEDAPSGEWVQITLKQTVEREDGKPAMIAETIFRTYF